MKAFKTIKNIFTLNSRIKKLEKENMRLRTEVSKQLKELTEKIEAIPKEELKEKLGIK